MKRRLNFSDKAGFTLIELIVVIAILAILGGVATVGYSGYVTKANEAADRQLISDIEQALIVGAYAKNYAPGSLVGAVGIDKEAAATAEGEAAAMMEMAFGADWSAGMKLVSDKFSTVDASSILEAIKNAEKDDGSNIFDSVPGSSFYNTTGNTKEIVSDVDEIATALNGVLELTPASFTMFWGEDFHNSVKDAGLTEEWKNDDQMAANLTVFAAANQIAGFTDKQKNNWIQSWTTNEPVAVKGTTNGYVSELVMNYAKCVAVYNYVVNDTTGKFDPRDKTTLTDYYEELTKDMQMLKTSQNGYLNDFNAALNKFNESVDDSFYEAWQDASNGKSQAQIDAEAFLASMTAIQSMEENYVNKDQMDLLKSANAFDKAGAADVLDTMVAYSGMDNLPEGDYVIVLTIAADGTPVITPTLQEE